MIDHKTENRPAVSVIIPSYNDPDGLRNTLNSLLSQDFPPQDYEIIIADNGSTDNTLNVAREYAAKYSDRVRIAVEDEIQSSYAARNKGILLSRGDILSFIDADIAVETDYLSRVVTYIRKGSVDYLGCQVKIYSKADTFSSMYNIATGFTMKHYLENDHFIGAGCLSVKRAVIDKVGRFDDRLQSGGDFEFGNRVFRAGFRQYYASDIIMKHPSRTSFKQLVRKAFRVGRGLQQISYYHPRFKGNRKIHRNIFNPLYFFPPLPWNFLNFMKGNEVWSRATAGEKLKMYLAFWYVDMIVKQLGYIYESRRNK